MKNLLQLLEDDSTLSHAQLAAMTGVTEDEVRSEEHTSELQSH